MKVALVVPDLEGAGAQRVMLDLAAGLAERGEAVEVVALRIGGQLRATVPEGVGLVDLDARRALAALPALVRYLRRARPDAAIACLSHVNLLTIAAARLAGRRTAVMVTQHNQLSVTAPRKPTRRGRAMPRLLRFGFRLADSIVAVSDGVAADLASTLGIERARIDVVYNPVDVARLVAAARSGQAAAWPGTTGTRLLAAGRLIEQKDFPTLLRAVALLPDARLLILGEGEQRPALERLASELGIADRVTFAGFLDDPYATFAAADVFVLSSQWEGLPTVLIEALALTPRVVATDCPSGPREILEGGRWGRLVPVGDPDALARAITEVSATAPADRSEALARYDRNTVTGRYLALLEARAIGGTRPRRG